MPPPFCMIVSMFLPSAIYEIKKIFFSKIEIKCKKATLKTARKNTVYKLKMSFNSTLTYHSPAQNSTVQNSTVQNSTVQNSTVQNSTVQNSTVQNSTVQKSSVQNSST